MRTQSATKENPPTAITPQIQPRMPWRVVHVEALPGFRIRVHFVDGTEGTVDLAELVNSSNAGVFAALADPAVFNQVFVQNGTVTWPGELDLAPDAMYESIRKKMQ